MDIREEYLYTESAGDGKDKIRSHLAKLMQHMMKAVVQSTYKFKRKWRLTVSEECKHINDTLDDYGGVVVAYYNSLSNENSKDLDEIRKDAWDKACSEMKLPVPLGSNPKKVYDNAYKEHEAIFMSWTPEDLKDVNFINNFIDKSMQDYTP